MLLIPVSEVLSFTLTLAIAPRFKPDPLALEPNGVRTGQGLHQAKAQPSAPHKIRPLLSFLRLPIRRPRSFSPQQYHLMLKTTQKPFVIGVAGGSGSGKSTVTRQVVAAIGPENVAVVMQDDYYRDQSHMPPEDRRKQNYDHPDAFDWPLMTQHLAALRKGEAIAMPVYDFAADNRSSDTITVAPAPVIVVEGLFALYDTKLRNMMSLKIYVDTASDVRFIRRLQRDISERGRSTESVVSQYMDTVRPMHKQFIEPTKRNADVILPHGANGPAVDIITTKVRSLLQEIGRG